MIAVHNIVHHPEWIIAPTAIMAVRALWKNMRLAKKCDVRVRPLRYQVSFFAFAYVMLFLAFAFDFIDQFTYTWLGTGLALPTFHFVWTKPAVISAKLNEHINQLVEVVEYKIDDAIEKTKESTGDE